MNKLLAAVALSIAIPAVAQAQSAPAPAAKMDCCAKMKGKMDCGKDMAMGDNAHAGHDMAKSGTTAPQADPHKNHQK